jgi:hypothetical protein
MCGFTLEFLCIYVLGWIFSVILGQRAYRLIKGRRAYTCNMYVHMYGVLHQGVVPSTATLHFLEIYLQNPLKIMAPLVFFDLENLLREFLHLALKIVPQASPFPSLQF